MAAMDELAAFMDAERADVRAMALAAFAGLTGTDDGLQAIARARALVLPPLLRALFASKDGEAEASRAALAALVNVSQEATLARELCGMKAVERLMEALHTDTENVCAGERGRLLAMALQNLTTLDEGCRSFAGELATLHVARLVAWLTATPKNTKNKQPSIEEELERVRLGVGLADTNHDEEEAGDTKAALAHVLTNITKTEEHEGRRALLEGNGELFLRVLPLMRRGAANVEVRKGVAGAARNCMRAAAVEFAAQLQAKEAEVGKVEEVSDAPAEEPYALPCVRSCTGALAEAFAAPLAGGGAEPDDDVRERAAESLLFLTEVEDEGVRAALWAKGVPDTIKKGYEYEEHPGVVAAMERIAESVMAAAGMERKVEVHETEVECGFTLPHLL